MKSQGFMATAEKALREKAPKSTHLAYRSLGIRDG